MHTSWSHAHTDTHLWLEVRNPEILPCLSSCYPGRSWASGCPLPRHSTYRPQTHNLRPFLLGEDLRQRRTWGDWCWVLILLQNFASLSMRGQFCSQSLPTHWVRVHGQSPTPLLSSWGMDYCSTFLPGVEKEGPHPSCKGRRYICSFIHPCMHSVGRY